MQEIIDVASDVSEFAPRLADAGVRTVIRYYNLRNSTSLPTKCLAPGECQALHAAGLSIAVVFQQRGGRDGNIGDFSAQNGARDAQRSLQLAAAVGQPAGSAIYFAVDWDYFRQSELAALTPYFAQARTVLAGAYRLGVYGSGAVGTHLRQRGIADFVWLAGATGWSGTRQALNDGNWTLFQRDLDRRSGIGAFTYDGNIANPAAASFGQFGAGGAAASPAGAGSAALLEVTARGGLNLRSGPGQEFRVLSTVPLGTLVTGKGREGDWIKVDLDGDGAVDGFMFASFLAAVSGGIPLGAVPGQRAVDVARAELALDVREIPGASSNPRIVMYHATTAGGAAPDETAWCSSFVNYCVEQAGQAGTRSKWARSWHDSGWGFDATAAPREGDIAVFRRQGLGVDGGHVAFFLDQGPGHLRVLGGNQGNRIGIADYPRNGTLGSFHYTLLSIRRA